MAAGFEMTCQESEIHQGDFCRSIGQSLSDHPSIRSFHQIQIYKPCSQLCACTLICWYAKTRSNPPTVWHSFHQVCHQTAGRSGTLRVF